MNCPKCESNVRTKVVDSRPKGRKMIFRRRLCKSCGYKFNTLEAVDTILVRHVKLNRLKRKLSVIKEQAEEIAKLAAEE